MELGFKINRIEKILKNNNIRYNSKFSRVITLEFTAPNSYGKAKETIDLIERMVIKGVNKGFKNYSEDIQSLIDCCLSLGDKNADRRMEKLIRKINEIEENFMGNEQKDRNKIDVRESVRKWVDTTLEGIEILLKQVKGTTHITALTSSKELILQIKEKIENVVDFSSRNAADLAMSIVNEITRFRNSAAERQFNDFTVDHLKNALNFAEQWGELIEAISLRNPRASEKDLPVYNLSNFDKILLCEKLKNKMLSFKENVDSFKEEIAQRSGTEQLTKEIEDLKNQKAEFEKEMISIKSQAQNGRISIDEAKRRIEIKKNSYLRIKDKIEVLEAKYTEKMEEFDVQRFAAMDMMEIYNDVMSYESDPTLFSILSEKLDLTGLHNVLRGTIKGEKAKQAFDSVYYVLRVMKEIKNSQVSNLQDMENIYNEAYKRSQETKVQYKTKQKEKEKESTMEDLDELFNEMDIPTEPTTHSEEETQEEQETSTNTVTLEDDIFNF